MSYLQIIILLIAILPAQDVEMLTLKRNTMVESQIVRRGVTDDRVLDAMRAVLRHDFVPKELQDNAYDDGPLPIGGDQTISQPYIVAYMTELLDLDSSHSVLEIGTGSGYQAAVLSLLAKMVYTIEIVPELGNSTARLLSTKGYFNVRVKIGDGYKGWPEVAPFDRIIITAAPEEIPELLLQQLKPGGKMVLPKGPQWWSQDLLVIYKDKDGGTKVEKTIPVRFVPMVRGRD